MPPTASTDRTSSTIRPTGASDIPLISDNSAQTKEVETVRYDADNGSVRSVPELIAEITSYLTLEAGDVIATGTPEGVGPLSDGDRVEVEIEGIGTLEHTVGQE